MFKLIKYILTAKKFRVSSYGHGYENSTGFEKDKIYFFNDFKLKIDCTFNDRYVKIQLNNGYDENIHQYQVYFKTSENAKIYVDEFTSDHAEEIVRFMVQHIKYNEMEKS